jgi:hypothetical protein
MLAIAMFVAALVIGLSWAARRSHVEDVAANKANNKPSGDDDNEPLNDLELSRSMGRTRKIVHEADRPKLTDLRPKQDHIQYLDYPGIRLMLDRAKELCLGSSISIHCLPS